MNKTPTTHASGGDTLVRVRRRACPRAGGFPTSSRIPFPTIVRLPAGGVFASTQHLIGAGRATLERTPHDMGSTPSRSTLPGVPRASGSRRGLRDAKGADIRAAPYVAARARAGSSAWENTGQRAVRLSVQRYVCRLWGTRTEIGWLRSTTTKGNHCMKSLMRQALPTLQSAAGWKGMTLTDVIGPMIRCRGTALVQTDTRESNQRLTAILKSSISTVYSQLRNMALMPFPNWTYTIETALNGTIDPIIWNSCHEQTIWHIITGVTEGREAKAVQPLNKTLEAPQYADEPGRRPAREGYAEGVDSPAAVGSNPTQSTTGAAKPSRRPGPRGDCYGCVRATKGAPHTATGHMKSGFDSPRGYPVSFTTTADASHPRGARPNLLELCLHPSACAVVESGPVRAATLDDNAHDELQE